MAAFMTGGAIAWLGNTLLATSLLLVLVLLIRRPVARLFGPQLAYALWAIPALRMVLPPVPVWSAPDVAGASVPAAMSAPGSAALIAASPVPTAPTVTESLLQALPDWWPLALAALWAGGVMIHLGWQWSMHRRLIRLLADADMMGRAGRVRLLISPAVKGPLSFGLRNPVVVLPPADRLGFSAAEQDLAIAHELTHHRRGDLWANFAASLFAALHWFNPLIVRAWTAFRFDQEAACDATVLDRADAATRSRYARALAKVATGRATAFSCPTETPPVRTIPMFASPMLGAEKLKERVSMIAQPTRSAGRRRFGTAMVVVLLFGALTATATSYAVDAQQPPAPPAPPSVPAPPAAPLPPGELSIITMPEGEGEHVTRIERDGATIILRTTHALSQEELARLVAEAEASRAEADRMAGTGEAADGAAPRQVRTIMIRRHGDAGQVDTSSASPVPPVPPMPPLPPVPPGEHRIVLRQVGGDGAPMALPEGCRAGSTHLVNVDQSSGEGDATRRVRLINCSDGPVTPAMRLGALRQARDSLAAAGEGEMGEARVAALRQLDREISQLEGQVR